MATMDLQLFGTSAPHGGLPGGDSARVTPSRSGMESFADAFESAAVENEKIAKKQLDSDSQGGSKQHGHSLNVSQRADQHSDTQTPHQSTEASDKASIRPDDRAADADENGKWLPPSARQSLPSSGSVGHPNSESHESAANVSGVKSEIDVTEALAGATSDEKTVASETSALADGGRGAIHGSPVGSASILEPRMEARVESSNVQVSKRSIGAGPEASSQSVGLGTEIDVDVDVDVDARRMSLTARDQVQSLTAAPLGQAASSNVLTASGGVLVEEAALSSAARGAIEPVMPGSASQEGADSLISQAAAPQAANAGRAMSDQLGTASVAIQKSTASLADAELAISSTTQASDASLMHAEASEDDGQWAASSSASASGMASHSLKGGAASVLQLPADLVEKPVALTQAFASASSHATDLEPASILGLNVARAAKGVGETMSQALGDGAVLQKPESTSLATPGQMARSGMNAPAAAGMNLQSAPTALAELDLGRMTKVALDPQPQANQTAIRPDVTISVNVRASGWSDGVRQQLERARFAAVMPHAKQTALVDSVARLPMVESLLSSLGQQTSPGEKLIVEPALLSSVKAGTPALDQALTTQSGLQQSVTQSITKSAQSLNPLYQGTVNARIEQTAWMAQIASHAKMAIKDDFRSVEIRLTPAHLGTIEILVSQDDEQTQLAFFTKHAQVREALEGQMPRLQKLFEEDGLKLGDAWVSDQSLAEHREHQTGAERDQDASTPPGFALDPRDTQLVGSMTAQPADSSAMLDVWA